MSDDLSGFSLFDLFRSEAEDLVAALSSGLSRLEDGGGADPESLESMMRSAHSLKGAARVVDLHPAVRVSHALEDCFDEARNGRVALGAGEVVALRRAVELIGELIQLEEGRGIAWELEHEARLVAVVQDVSRVTKGTRASPSG